MAILVSVFAGAYLRTALAVVRQFARRTTAPPPTPALAGSDPNAHETSCGCFPSDFGGRKFEALLFLTAERLNVFFKVGNCVFFSPLFLG